MKFLLMFALFFVSSSAFSAPAEEETLSQLNQFIVVALTVFSFMFGAQFGHTR